MKRTATVALFLLLLCVGLDAYVLLGVTWPDGFVVMHLQLGSSGTLIDGSTSWGRPAEAALADWNVYVNRVKFQVVRDSTAPIDELNGVNNVFWDSATYGHNFDPFVLAATSEPASPRRSGRWQPIACKVDDVVTSRVTGHQVARLQASRHVVKVGARNRAAAGTVGLTERHELVLERTVE